MKSVEVSGGMIVGADGSSASSGVDFGHLRRVTPLSRAFGYDRGQAIDRYYIEKFLNRNASDIRGRVLEIEDNTYTRRFGGQGVTQSDVLHNEAGSPRATIVADLANAPGIPSNTFHCAICTQTLHLIYEIRSAVQTLHRILKPNGVLLATFPGISKNNDRNWHEEWHWGLTPLAAMRLFAENFRKDDITVEAFGNVLTVASFLYGLPSGQFSQAELDYSDPGYEGVITVRAQKAPPE